MSANPKLVLIGLDGATFRVLHPLVDACVMPTVARFLKEGASGVLHSTRPPVTCPAWPTMFTGVNPGKHGVFSFTCRRGKDARPHTASSLDVRAPTIWELVGRAGRRVGVMNVPITFPAQPVNGFMVAGFPAPAGSGEIIWPRSEYEDAKRDLPGFVVNWPGVGQRMRTQREQIQLVESVNALMRARNRAFEYFLDRHQIDFCYLVFEYPDKVQHRFYPLLESMNGLAADPYGPVLRLLQDGYREIDAAIGRLVERFGDDTNYLIVSDHGFGPVRRVMYLNHFLERHGLLAARHVKAVMARALMHTKLPVGLRSRLGLSQDEPWHRLDTWTSPLIDYPRTRAFTGHQYEHAVYINEAGKCPQGIVRKGADYENVRQQVIKALRQATDPKSGKAIFEGVWPREEIYTGPYVEQAPDIIFDLVEGYTVSAGVGLSAFLDGGFLRDSRNSEISGYHLPEGVFLGYGPAFRAGQNVEATLYDIVPTVLGLMGIEIPDELDGQVIEGALKPESLTYKSRRHEAAVTREISESSAYTPEEEQEITRRLAELGYL